MIVVICVAFVGVIVILGILRIRAAHKRTAREELQAEVEMAWDDSALNIVVNPLDVSFECEKVDYHIFLLENK